MELPRTSDEKTLETELTSSEGQSQSKLNTSDQTGTVPESAQGCQGNPRGAGRGGAAGRVTGNERSTNYGEGERQPAKTGRNARG